MHVRRSILGFALGALLAVACGGDDNKPAGGSSTFAKAQACSQQGGSKCSAAESEEYGKCVMSKCDTAYKKCLGDSYASGSFGGACGPHMACTNKCGCDDNACRMACGIPPMDCLNCLLGDVNTCVMSSGCKLACATAGTPDASAGGTTTGGTTGNTCADLMKCCAQLTGMAKDQCNMFYNSVKAGGDPACSVAIGTYKSSGQCK